MKGKNTSYNKIFLKYYSSIIRNASVVPVHPGIPNDMFA
jgi:hypothetical protein